MADGPHGRASPLADQIVRVAKPYLGLATGDLLRRVTRSMVGVELESIEASNLASLAYWTRIAALKVMPEGRANELADRIAALGNGRS